MSSRRSSRVAHVEDYNSDEGEVVPDTRRDAGNHGPPTKLMHMHNKRRDAASDSGYSSHATSSTHSQPATGNQHVRQNSQPAVPLAIGRRQSLREQPRSSRSSSLSRCTNPECGDPKCASSKDTETRFTLPHHRPPPQRSQTTQYPVQDATSSSPYGHAPNNPHPHHSAGPPPLNYHNAQAESRQRAPTTSRSRPTSWAPGPYPYANAYPSGNPVPQGSYGATAQGPIPTPSAYHRNSYMAQYPAMSADWQAMPPPMTSGSPHDPFGPYLRGPGVPMATPAQPYLQNHSARLSYTTTPGQDVLTPAAVQRQPSQPTISARHASVMPGSFPGEVLTFGPPSESESDSETSESEDDEDRRRRVQSERDRARRALEDKKAMPPPRERMRRPTLTHTQTTPAGGRHRSRETPRRALYSEPDLSSSDYVDSDRTTRPVIGRRPTNPSNRDGHRPSVTHHEQPSRERAYSSHNTRQYVVEDANGHKRYYKTREEAEYKASRLDQQKLEDEIEAYQANKRGNKHPATLTTENVKRAQTHQQEKKPASHVSGSSRKSTSSRMSASESTIQIKRGDAVYTIPADRTVEITTKEGEVMIIGAGSPPREKSYHGSSSGSRMGRSRAGSEYGGGRRRDTIAEEGGYERAL